MKYPNVASRILNLVEELNKVQTHFPYERRYIGEAISHLILLKDILEDINKKDSENEKAV